MSKYGNDCHFYYNSTCSKGDKCAFRHVEEAKKSAVTCTYWRQQICAKASCPYRHAEVKSNASVACYWENQPGGCTKTDCPFMHSKPHLTQEYPATSSTMQEDHVPVIEPIIVNPASDSDMDSPRKKPPEQFENSAEDDGGESSEQGVQQISVIIKKKPVTLASQMQGIKSLGPRRNTPWKRTPFQQHMHKQQLQKKNQFQLRQQQQARAQNHVSQPQQEPISEPVQEQPSTSDESEPVQPKSAEKENTSQVQPKQGLLQRKEQQKRQQHRNDLKNRQHMDNINISKTLKREEKHNRKQLNSREDAGSSNTQGKNIIRTKRETRTEVPKPEPKKELPKIKKIIKKVVSSEKEGADDLGIKSLEQTLRERALRSMGIVEVIVKKETKETNKSDEEDGSDEESEKEENSAEESGSEEEGSEEVEEEEEEEEEEEGEEEEEKEDDLEDPEEIEILPADVDVAVGEEQEEGSEEEEQSQEEEEEQEDSEAEEVNTEDTRKAVKIESKNVKQKKIKIPKDQKENKSGVHKRHVLDRLGKKVRTSADSKIRLDRQNVGAQKSGNIIKLRRSSKSREELKLHSKNRIKPDTKELPESSIGSTNTGTIRLSSKVKGRLGNRDDTENRVKKKSGDKNSATIKSRLGWKRTTESSTEHSDYSDELDERSSPRQKLSVKNRLGWNRDKRELYDSDSTSKSMKRYKERSRELYDSDSTSKSAKRYKERSRELYDSDSTSKSMKRYKERSRELHDSDSTSKSNKKYKERSRRKRKEDVSDEFSDSLSEAELHAKAKKLRKKLIDFDIEEIEDILLERRRKKLKSKRRKLKKMVEELSEESDYSDEGDRRRAKLSKSSERGFREVKRRRKSKSEEEDDVENDLVSYVPPSKPTGITFQVTNDLSRRQVEHRNIEEEDNFSENSDSNEDTSTLNVVQGKQKRGWTKAASDDDEDIQVKSEVKKAKISRIQWGSDKPDIEEKVTPVVRSNVVRKNTSWSTRDTSNKELAARNEMPIKSRIDVLDEANEEKVKKVQIKSLEDIRKEKAQKYISDESSEEELDPMEALRQRIHGKAASEGPRQTQKLSAEAKRRNRQAQQIYVPPPRKRTVELAFDDDNVVSKKKERISPVQDVFNKPGRISPVQVDMFEDKPQRSGKAEVKTFAEIMAEKRARAKMLREQSAKVESQSSSSLDKPSKPFKPIVFDIDDGGTSKSVSPMNRFTDTSRKSPTPAAVAVDIEDEKTEERERKSHKHKHKSKSGKRKWRKKKSKSKLEDDSNSRDYIEDSNSRDSVIDDTVTESLVSSTINDSVPDTQDMPSKSEKLTLPDVEKVPEKEVVEIEPKPASAKKEKSTDDWLNFDFGDDDLDVGKGDTKDEDELLREIDELLA